MRRTIVVIAVVCAALVPVFAYGAFINSCCSGSAHLNQLYNGLMTSIFFATIITSLAAFGMRERKLT